MINRILIFALVAFVGSGFVFDFDTESPFYLINAIALFIGFLIIDFTINPVAYCSQKETDDE